MRPGQRLPATGPVTAQPCDERPPDGAELVLHGRIMPASNATFLGEIEGVRVVYKPVSGERPRTGTSFAAPFVSAAAALIKADNPGFSAEEVRIVLENQADDLGSPGRDDVFGWGLLDIRGLCRP